MVAELFIKRRVLVKSSIEIVVQTSSGHSNAKIKSTNAQHAFCNNG